MELVEPDLESLSSGNLEDYVSAIFKLSRYYVNQNLIFAETQADDEDRTVSLFELDIIALNFHPFGEDRLLVEVKGGGTFTDFFKFLGIKTYLKTNLAYLITNNSKHYDDLYNAGIETSVNVLKFTEVIDSVSNDATKDHLNFWFWSNQLSQRLIERDNLIRIHGGSFNTEENESYQMIRKYLAMVNGKIWKTLDPIEQSVELKSLLDENRGFVRSILRKQKKELTDTENAISLNILCESASYVVLLTKVYYVVSAVRCAIYSVMTPGTDYLDSIEDGVFRSVVDELKTDINLACGLPNFIQFWIYLAGGMFDSQNGEIDQLSSITGLRAEDFDRYIKLLKSIFVLLTPNGEIQWSLNERDSILEFNHIPNSLRGLGIKFRESLGIDTSNFIYKKMFLDRLEEI